LGESVLHEISGAEMEDVEAIDGIEFLLEVMETDDRAGARGFVGADAAEGDDRFDAGGADGGGNGVADAFLKGSHIVGADIGWDENVGGFGAFESVVEGGGVSGVGGDGFGTALGQGMKMFCVSADDADLLTAIEKSVGHDGSGVAAGS